jgi:methionyl-tRNA formyltransferase
VLQPEKLKDPVFIEQLKLLQADLFIVVAFRMLPVVVWSMPPRGTFNLHGSLLPDYRGAAPINWAIINGEKETGVTTFFLQHEIDTGDIIHAEKIPISESETAGTLHDRMMAIGAQLVLKTVQDIEAGKVQPIPQTPHTHTHPAPKIHTADCELDFSQGTTQVYNRIRGLSPYPGAFTKLNHKLLKVFMAQPVVTAHKQQAGFVETDSLSYLRIYTTDGYLALTDIQLEGKKRMPVTDFLKGYKFA